MLNSIYGTVTGKNSKQLFLENNGIEFDMYYSNEEEDG